MKRWIGKCERCGEGMFECSDAGFFFAPFGTKVIIKKRVQKRRQLAENVIMDARKHWNDMMNNTACPPKHYYYYCIIISMRATTMHVQWMRCINEYSSYFEKRISSFEIRQGNVNLRHLLQQEPARLHLFASFA